MVFRKVNEARLERALRAVRAGKVTATEAARWSGVSLRTVRLRLPDDFDWEMRRDRYVASVLRDDEP